MPLRSPPLGCSPRSYGRCAPTGRPAPVCARVMKVQGCGPERAPRRARRDQWSRLIVKRRDHAEAERSRLARSCVGRQTHGSPDGEPHTPQARIEASPPRLRSWVVGQPRPVGGAPRAGPAAAALAATGRGWPRRCRPGRGCGWRGRGHRRPWDTPSPRSVPRWAATVHGPCVCGWERPLLCRPMTVHVEGETPRLWHPPVRPLGDGTVPYQQKRRRCSGHGYVRPTLGVWAVGVRTRERIVGAGRLRRGDGSGRPAGNLFTRRTTAGRRYGLGVPTPARSWPHKTGDAT